MAFVAGIDGCRGGWVVVTAPAEGSGDGVTVECVPDLDSVIARLDAGHLAAAGIDIHIGLPAAGPRRCDVEARKLIVPRHNSVFPAPSRGVLGATSYREALARSRKIGGKGISKQTFAILPKIAAVDAIMTPARQRHLFEVHPEVCFRVLAGHGMSFHKANVQGRTERLTALRTVFPDIDSQSLVQPVGASPDDILDAFVVAWSARRWLAKSHDRLGGDRDERGLRMEIIV